MPPDDNEVKVYINEDNAVKFRIDDSVSLVSDQIRSIYGVPLSSAWLGSDGTYINYDQDTNTINMTMNTTTTTTTTATSSYHDAYYTTQRPWSYNYDRLHSMYCEHCGKEEMVKSEDFRLNYICEECKSSVPLLTVMRRFFRTSNR